MDDRDLRLDGNAAAGMLGEVFAFEVTMATLACAGCGQVTQLGALMAYEHGMGTVLRCVRCDGTMVRVGHPGERYVLDLRGTAWLEVGG